MAGHTHTRRSLLAGLGAFAARMSAAAESKPNIVFIFADDMGWKDCRYTGSDFYETPNIDAFAKQGMVFTQAYACGANRAPSRACLICRPVYSASRHLCGRQH